MGTATCTAARRCTSLCPSFAKGHFRLGQALRLKGDLADAADAFRAGLPHASGAELADLKREVTACEAELKKSGVGKASASIGKAKPSPVSITEAAPSYYGR